jgi:hypothetical protein
MRYALINAGSLADSKAFPLLAAACDVILKEYAALKRLDPSQMEVQPFPSIDSAPDGWVKTLVQQTLDVDGAMAYHDRDAQGNPIVLCGYGLVPGGEIFRGKTGNGDSLLGELGHELLETEEDESANQWVDLDVTDPQDPTNVFHLAAKEPADPTQETFDTITVNGTVCDRTNYVLNAWYNSQVPAGTPVDRMGVLTRPGTIAPGGYCIVRRAYSEEGQVFARALRLDHRVAMADWRMMKKSHPRSRTQRRLSQVVRIG